jgi:hypothetical protein
MTDEPKREVPLEIESGDWLQGKSEEDLLADLKHYLARLRDNPHAIPDRLRVATIQLKLGRTQEALVHYEGVLRGYVQEGRVMNAIALCKRIIAIYPDVPRIQRLLAALYARAPHGSTGAPSPVEPIATLEERPTTTFVVEEEEEATDRDVKVDVEVRSVFPDVLARQQTRMDLRRRGGEPEDPDARTTEPYPQQELERPVGLDELPTNAYQDGESKRETAVLLTRQKRDDITPGKETSPPARRRSGHEPAPEEDDGELVVLLTKKKKK